MKIYIKSFGAPGFKDTKRVEQGMKVVEIKEDTVRKFVSIIVDEYLTPLVPKSDPRFNTYTEEFNGAIKDPSGAV